MENMRLVVIRKARVDDEQAVLKIHQAAIEASCKEYYRPEQIQAWAVPRGLPPFAQILKQTVFLVAEYVGEVVAFSHMDLKQGIVVTLFASPSHMAHGIGTKLLHEIESIARASGLTSVSLDSTLNAVRFYEHRGYRREAEVVHTEPDGTQIECVRMSKAL
jgi:GNAT superfamily N-acetyltransferase